MDVARENGCDLAVGIRERAGCYYEIISKIVRSLLPLVVLICWWNALLLNAHEQSASAVLNGPQNMDQGLQNGLNNITGYVEVLLSGAKMLEVTELAYPKEIKTIGNLVRRRHLDLGLTQTEVGLRLGVHAVTLSEKAKGHSPPSK